MTTSLCNDIDWVGYVDWNVRDFHGYETSRGATYNSYLIRDEKNVLIDTVKGPYAGNLISNISKFIDPVKLDYIVCNHAEPDHSSSIPMVLEACPNAVVVCNVKCKEILSRYYDTSAWKWKIIEDHEKMSIGRRTLHFINTPMVHWPESMFTYVPEEKLLFSMDAFGQHYATSQRFDDQNPVELALEEAKIYYANIVMLYGKRVTKILHEAEGLEIDIIAPSHGVIWRSHVKEILDAYHNWAECKAVAKVIILFDSMWNSTGMMADAIYEGALHSEVEVKLFNVRRTSLTMLATEFLDCAVVACGSSTLNQGMMPMVSAALTYIKGLKPTGKAGFAFGSYGWSKSGAEGIEEILKDMKFEILREPLVTKYRPDEEALKACYEAGQMLAKKAIEMS